MAIYKKGDEVGLKSGLKGQIEHVIDNFEDAAHAFYQIRTKNGMLKLDGLHIIGLIDTQLATKLSRIPERVVHWFAKAEEGYGTTLFYTGDIDKMDPSKKQKVSVTSEAVGGVGPDRIKLFDLDYQRLNKLAHNGTSDGFIGIAKNFSLNIGTRPSDAVRGFINGKLTVCECEGMMYVVYLNAICDLLGECLFDHAFRGLKITQGGNEFTKWFAQVKTPTEETCNQGDWVYYVHRQHSAEKFRELAKHNNRGGAATGWNLLCASQGVTNTYFGFGLANEQRAKHSLAEVRDIMIKECGGNPVDKGWDLYLHFRRRVSASALQKWVNNRFE